MWFCCSVLCILFYVFLALFFFFKQKTAYEMRISDWSSDVCSSDLVAEAAERIDGRGLGLRALHQFEQPHVARRVEEVGDGEIGGEAVRQAQIGRASCRERVCQYV